MIERIIIAGAGGQGVVLLGKVLASAALKENKYVTVLASYGAEVRGGCAHSMVIISDREISSPYIEKADTLIILNQPSLDKLKNRLKDNGLLILNSSLTKIDNLKNTHLLKQPFTDTALKLGNIRVANMVALGCFIATDKIIDAKSALDSIEELTLEDKRELIQLNKQALIAGIKTLKPRR